MSMTFGYLALLVPAWASTSGAAGTKMITTPEDQFLLVASGQFGIVLFSIYALFVIFQAFTKMVTMANLLLTIRRSG
ncbi:MAG: hypothetical protein AABY89_11085 [Acidobacteriota bacterium]